MTTGGAEVQWQPICRLDQLQPERGAAALVGMQQIAIFLTYGGTVYALDNIDPFTGSAVLSRGIVGNRGAVATVTAPLHKQVFSLETGHCLDVEGVAVPSFEVRVRGGRVEVGL